MHRARSSKARPRRLLDGPRAKRLLGSALVAGLAATALAAAAVAITFWVYARDERLPSVAALKNFQPPQVTRILAPGARGLEVIGELGERRTVVTYADIPPLL